MLTRQLFTLIFLPACLLAASSGVIAAERGAKSESRLAKPGEVVLHDDFERSELGDDWRIAKGAWTIEDACLVGKEIPADKHAAVATIGGTHRNSIVKFRFQLQGAKNFHLSLNKDKGHLFRVVITEQGMSLSLDKDKSDPQSKPQQLARADGEIAAGKWHTLQLEMVGDQVAARIDDRLTVTGKHASLDCDKPGYRFIISGESVRIDDLTVHAVD